MGWLILGIYLIGIVPAFRYAVPVMMRALDKEAESLYYEDLKKAHRRKEKWLFLFASVVIVLIWPISIPLRLLYRVLISTEFAKTPAELAERERAELERLRAQARELELPFPEEK